MNTNTVISLPVSTDLSANTNHHRAVKLTSTGIALASSVTDRVIGTLIRGNNPAANVGDTVVGRAADVFLSVGNGLHFITLGAGDETAISMGDELQLDTTDGTYCIRTTGECAAIAVDSAPASSAGGQIRAILLPPVEVDTPSIESVTTTNVITASENGKVFILNAAGGFVSTLPAPAAGLQFTFIVGTAPTTSYTVVTASSANIIHGQIASAEDAAGSVATAASADTITFVANKAIKGDRVEVISDGTNWFVTGFCNVQDGITTTQAS